MSSITAKPRDFSALRLKIEEARDAMSVAIRARSKPEIVQIFVKTKQHIHAEAKASEIYFEETKDAEAQHKASEARLGAERLMGQWLGILEETKLRFMGQPGKGTKIGAPLDPAIITREDLNLDATESKQFQAVAKLSPTEFAAFVTSDKPTSALITARRSSQAGHPTHSIALSSISVPHRLRALRPDKVDALAGSMRDRGLIYPITVRPFEEGKYPLNTGHHRYAAAHKLGWEKIDCIIRKGLDAVEAELCEIDENLIRADLTPAERAAHHARRKELYERKHPETKRTATLKRGQQKAPSRQNGETENRYTKDTAEKVGGSERTIQRHVERGKNIPNVAELSGTSLDQGGELDALAKLKDFAPERQTNLIEKAKGGEKVSAKAELKKAGRDEPPNDVAQPGKPAPVRDAAPPTAPDQPAPTSDSWACQRAAFYSFILGLKSVDLGRMFASMPIEELQDAKDVVFALSAALDAAIERAAPAENRCRQRHEFT